MDARDQWILFFSAAGVALSCLIVWLVIRIKSRVDSLHEHSNGVPQGDIGAIRTDISDMRRHMVSNHDEVEGELRMLASSTDRIALEIENERQELFAKQMPDELAKARAAKGETPT
jgi:hypothetical protein